jgi:DNA repair protein RadC
MPSEKPQAFKDLLGVQPVQGLPTAFQAKPTPPHFHGHRERLRARLAERGANSLADYELLELLLTIAIPRRDVKPLAKQLLTMFGDLPGVFAANDAALLKVKGIGQTSLAALRVVEATAVRLAQQRVLDKPVLASWMAVLDYVRVAMAHAPIEQFRVLFLNQKNALMADEVQQTGTVNHTPVYPREVMKRALELGATAVILVHNHPSGDPTPSRDDIEITKEIIAAGKPLGVAVHDHLIIGKGGHSSLKSLGLI